MTAILAIVPDTDDIQRVATALELPGAKYLERLDEAQQAIASQSAEASRQLETFIERVRDLTGDELRELYDETFRSESLDVRRTLSRLALTSLDDSGASAAMSALEPLLARLEAERNPFVYVVRCLCCLLLRETSQFERSS